VSAEEEPDAVHRLVRRWAQAVNARDRDALVATSDPAIDVYPLQIATVGGHYVGHDGMRRWIDDMFAGDVAFEVRFVGIRTLPDGRIALFGEIFVEGKFISPYSMIATARDGMIVAMRSYLSDEETMEHLKLIAPA
jgi:hypothetical protein